MKNYILSLGLVLLTSLSFAQITVAPLSKKDTSELKDNTIFAVQDSTASGYRNRKASFSQLKDSLYAFYNISNAESNATLYGGALDLESIGAVDTPQLTLTEVSLNTTYGPRIKFNRGWGASLLIDSAIYAPVLDIGLADIVVGARYPGVTSKVARIGIRTSRDNLQTAIDFGNYFFIKTIPNGEIVERTTFEVTERGGVVVCVVTRKCGLYQG